MRLLLRLSERGLPIELHGRGYACGLNCKGGTANNGCSLVECPGNVLTCGNTLVCGFTTCEAAGASG